jgi:hypothetical protein
MEDTITLTVNPKLLKKAKELAQENGLDIHRILNFSLEVWVKHMMGDNVAK